MDATAVRRWQLAVMTAFALGGVSLATWGPRLAGIRADLRLGDGAVGLVLAGVTVGSLAGLVASSALLSRLGSRRALGGTLCLVAAGIGMVGMVGVGAGVLRSVALAVTGFLCIGAGIGTVDVLINVEAAALERVAGRTLMPLMHAAWSAGAILGSALGAAAAALRIAYQWQFVGEAVAIALVAAVAVRSLPRRDRPDEGQPSAPFSARVRGWLRGWLEWRLLLIGLVMLGVELGEGTANSWLTLAVRDGHHQRDAVAALFFTAFAVGETLARVAGGPLVDRVGRMRAVRVTTALGMVGLLVFIVAVPAWLVLLGTLLWAVGVSMGFPLGMSAAADSGPDPAARVSVVASIGYLANLGGPPLIGFLAQAFGLLHAFVAVVALLGLGFAAAGTLRARNPVAVSPPPAT